MLFFKLSARRTISLDCVVQQLIRVFNIYCASEIACFLVAFVVIVHIRSVYSLGGVRYVFVVIVVASGGVWPEHHCVSVLAAAPIQ